MQLIFKTTRTTRKTNKFSFQRRPPKYRGTILSDEAFTPDKYVFKKEKKVRRYKTPRKSCMKQYPRVLMKPVEGWYPSGYASFKLDERIDVTWLLAILPLGSNPSLWESKNDVETLRVPKNFKNILKRLFRKNALCYSRTKNLWYPRKTFDKWQKRLRKREERDAVKE